MGRIPTISFQGEVMLRLCTAIFAALTVPLLAQPHVFHMRTTAMNNCKFEIPQTADALACDNDLDRGVPSICTAKMINSGTDACTGHFAGYVGPATLGSVDQASTTGITTVCRPVGLTSLPSTPPLLGVSVLETAALCEGDGNVPPGGTVTMSARITPSLTFPNARFTVGVTDSFGGWTNEVVAQFDLANCNLSLSSPSVSQSGVPYNVTWTAAQSSTTYQVDEATKADFSDAKTTTTSDIKQQFTHTATGTATPYYYRVRASSCRGSQGPYSITAITSVAPAADSASKTFDLVVPQGSTTVVVQQVHVGGLTANAGFAATVDQSYLTVTPSTGTVQNDGSVDLTVRADPSTLPVGASTGTVTITTAHAKTGNKLVALDGNTASVPISVSVATPVTQAPKTPPPATTWIVPAVAHQNGIGAQFISDIRLANANASAASSYQLTFTQSQADGSRSGRQTKIDVAPGQVIALNDILRDVFGLATTTADASGVLEVRTLGTPNSGTVVTSRMYSVATAGTYGQFVPAVPIDRVATAAAAPLLLSHIGQSAAQRMNVGIVESLGFATTGHLRAFSASGQLLKDVPFTLQPFEHRQINSFLARNGVTLTNGHIEVAVDAAPAGTTSGGVTAYASMLDNATNDASVVAGVKSSSLSASRYVLPGVSEGTSTGDHSEVRILNAGTAAVDATLTFYPEGGTAPAPKNVTLAAGEVKSFDNIVQSLFGASGQRGALVVSTTAAAPLLVTGRTFSAASSGGTFGQLQTAVTPADGITTGDPEVEILQLEESDKFRSNLGLVEVSGASATAHVTLFTPDAKVTASVDVPLNANESRTAESIIRSMGVNASTYNARLAVKVTSGSGRVAAFGSLVDKATNDPTLLAAQR